MTIQRNLTGTGLSGLAAIAITGSVADGLVATGTTQTDALLLSDNLNVFATVASGAGCIFPQGSENDEYSIVNGGANALKIYPPTGGTISGAAINTAYSLPSLDSMKCVFQNYNTIIIAPGSVAIGGGGSVTVAAGKTLTIDNSLELAGTDGTKMTFPSTNATIARIDAANTFTGHQTIEGVTSTGATGTGAFVFATSPALVTPALGVATATSINGNVLTTGSSTYTGTAAQTYTFPTTSATIARTDAANTFTGGQGIGGAAGAGTSLLITSNITGATAVHVVQNNGTIQSDVTSAANGYRTNLNTQAAAFTLASLYHFRAAQGTIGAASAVTDQRAFYADSSVTGATNNYGFFSDIASGSLRWNFYANGTANNAFAGNTRLGAATAPTVACDVTGAVSATTSVTAYNATAVPAGGTAGTGVLMSSTANLGLFFGSGVPTLSAAQGSIYIRTDGSSISTRLYINTTGSTTWTNVVTAA